MLSFGNTLIYYVLYLEFWNSILSNNSSKVSRCCYGLHFNWNFLELSFDIRDHQIIAGDVFFKVFLKYTMHAGKIKILFSKVFKIKEL